ncbi:MAG: DNA methylase, partial [Thermoplasmata archaeon]
EAEKELGGFYKGIHENEIPVGYIWARTVPCQNPSCGIMIPLMRQFWLAKKPKRMIALHPVVRGAGNDVEFEIVGKDVQGYKPWPENFEPANGTVSRAKVRCPACGTTIDDKTTRRLFIEGKAGQRMVVVVFTDAEERGKGYRLATEKDFEMFKGAEKYLEKKRQELKDKWGIDPVPDEPMPPKETLGFRVQRYGMLKWGDLFNSRQKLALITFVEKVRQAYEKMLAEGMEEDFAKAVICYLGLGIDNYAEKNNVLNRWVVNVEAIAGCYAMQALPMQWQYVEGNPFYGNIEWNSLLDFKIGALFKWVQNINFFATVTQSSATSPENEEPGSEEDE